jgi:hypothetical protein
MNMKQNKAALIIQHTWCCYISTKCASCSLPVKRADSPVRDGYCSCNRCPGCLKLNKDSMPCSVECSPWFPPMLSDDANNYMDEKIYERWVNSISTHAKYTEQYTHENPTYCVVL